jgi:ribosomal protein S18 acetylase RimI-like enzyme
MLVVMVSIQNAGKNQLHTFLNHRENQGQFVSGASVGWVFPKKGYVSLTPVPGLPSVADLGGLVMPAFRRQGIGTALLQHAQRHAPIHQWLKITLPVPNLHTPTAKFLKHNQFQIDHKERTLSLSLKQFTPSPLPPNLKLVSLPKEKTVSTFIQLYNASFAPHPWHQPYTPQEVRQGLPTNPILFLLKDGTPVGYVWLRLNENKAQLEPIGIHPLFQGQGLGKALLLSTLDYAQRQNIKEVSLGVWQSNQRAVRLYESVGFKNAGKTIYLAKSLIVSGK